MRQNLDIDSYMRSLIVSSATSNIDSYDINGNNYCLVCDYLACSNVKLRRTNEDKFMFLPFDFDAAFRFRPAAYFQSPTTNYTLAKMPPLLWGSLRTVNWVRKISQITPSPLSRLVKLEPIRSDFISNYTLFIQKIYRPEAGLFDRAVSYMKMQLPVLKQDHWYLLDTYQTAEDITEEFNNNFLPFIKERMAFLANYINN